MSAITNDGLTMMERLERTGSFLPKGVAYATNCGARGSLKFVTYAELLQARKDRQAAHLRRLLSNSTCRRAGFIWVFHTPGIGGGIFGGWWAYIRTLQGDEALDFRGMKWDLISQAMAMFPCGVLPQPENFDLWKTAFAAEHHRSGRFKKQGVARVWVNFDIHSYMTRLERAN